MSKENPQAIQPSSHHWWLLATLVVIAGGLFFAIQGLGASITRPARDLVYLWGTINLAIYLWIRICSPFSAPRQQSLVLLSLLVQAAVSLAVRTDGFAGDGRVIFKWRWSPTADERWRQVEPINYGTDSTKHAPLPVVTDYPAFRGADRSGSVSIPHLDWDWESHPPRELWRRSVGPGWSSFSVVGQQCVTQEQRGEHESIVGYDLPTGRELWVHHDQTRFDELTSGAGPRATPTIHDGRVYSLGATGVLNCLELATGNQIWGTNLFHGKKLPIFGFTSSPWVGQEYVYVTLGDEHGSLVAIDRKSGDVVWRQETRSAGYSSPQSWTTTTGDQMLVFDGIGLHGHDSTTGETLWSLPWGGTSDQQVNVGQPILVPPETGSQLIQPEDSALDLFLISSGYGRGTALMSLMQRADHRWEARERWQSKSLKSKFSSIVIKDLFAYGLDEGILTCISLRDGSRKWKRGRYGYGQILLVNDVLLIQAESGRVHLVWASPASYQEVASLKGLADRTWNQPTLAGPYLLLRNDREAVCYLLPTRGDLPK